MSHQISSKIQSSTNFDHSRPNLPPQHYNSVLETVIGRQNYLDLGMETGQNFFQLYHQFQGKVVGLDLNSHHIEFLKQKAERILPKQALSRSQIQGGSNDLFELSLLLKDKFDLVTVGHEIENFGNPNRFFDFVKEKLLSEEGTLALISTTPISVELQSSLNESHNTEIKKDFQNLYDVLNEYQMISNNPYFNQGLHMKHFSRSKKIEENIQNVISAHDLFEYIRTIPAFRKYQKDVTQVDKSALDTFSKRLNYLTAKSQQNSMQNQQILLKVTQRVLTYLLKK